MRRPSQALKRALVELRALVAALPEGARLPTIAILASRAGVAKGTMSRAVEILKSEGLVRVAQGDGIRSRHANLPACTPQSALPSPPLRRWQQVREQLAHDIVQGVYAAGSPLPSFKVLCTRYGTCYASAKRALRTLSLVEPARHGYRVRGSRRPLRSTTLVFAACTDDTGALCRFTNRSPDFWRALERWCFDNQVALEIATVRNAARVCARQHSLLGCILWTPQLDSIFVNECAAQLVRQGVRTAIVRDNDDYVPGPAILRMPNCRAFSPTTHREAGKAIGTHLLTLGHSRIAVFSRDPGISWSTDRLDGLRDAYLEAGLDRGITVCPWEPDDTWGVLLAGSLSATNRFAAQVQNDCASFETMLRVRYRDFPRLRLDRELAMVDQLLFDALKPRLADMLQNTSITAWVGIHDTIAYLLHDYLLQTERIVGRDISLAGFDDELYSFAKGLTSYNYNVAGLVGALMGFLVGALQRPPLKNGLVVVPGFVMTRSSTGQALARYTPR